MPLGREYKNKLHSHPAYPIHIHFYDGTQNTQDKHSWMQSCDGRHEDFIWVTVHTLRILMWKYIMQRVSDTIVHCNNKQLISSWQKISRLTVLVPSYKWEYSPFKCNANNLHLDDEKFCANGESPGMAWLLVLQMLILFCVIELHENWNWIKIKARVGEWSVQYELKINTRDI